MAFYIVFFFFLFQCCRGGGGNFLAQRSLIPTFHSMLLIFHSLERHAIKSINLWHVFNTHPWAPLPFILIYLLSCPDTPAINIFIVHPRTHSTFPGCAYFVPLSLIFIVILRLSSTPSALLLAHPLLDSGYL